MGEEIPTIEQGIAQDAFVNGILRIDNLGSTFRVHYFQLVREPEINGGAPFRVPVLRVAWPREDFVRSLGSVSSWYTTGLTADTAPQHRRLFRQS